MVPELYSSVQLLLGLIETAVVISFMTVAHTKGESRSVYGSSSCSLTDSGSMSLNGELLPLTPDSSSVEYPVIHRVIQPLYTSEIQSLAISLSKLLTSFLESYTDPSLGMVLVLDSMLLTLKALSSDWSVT